MAKKKKVKKKATVKPQKPKATKDLKSEAASRPEANVKFNNLADLADEIASLSLRIQRLERRIGA